ncbi:MAG: hypothetical protein Tsb0020_35330 [Haliangiales bacterium]
MNTRTISLTSLLMFAGAVLFPITASAQPAPQPSYSPPAQPAYVPPPAPAQPTYGSAAPAQPAPAEPTYDGVAPTSPAPAPAPAQPAYSNTVPQPQAAPAQPAYNGNAMVQPQAAPAQPAPAPAAEPASTSSRVNDLLSNIQVGFGFLAGGMTSDKYGEADGAFGYGLFARYRFNYRWEAEASIGVDRLGLANGATREFRPIGASVLAYLLNLRGVEVYGRAGLGRSSETYTNNANSRPVLEFSATHFHLGAGATYVLRQNIGISAELQWSLINRSESPDSESFSSSGTRYGLSASYHF